MTADTGQLPAFPRPESESARDHLRAQVVAAARRVVARPWGPIPVSKTGWNLKTVAEWLLKATPGADCDYGSGPHLAAAADPDVAVLMRNAAAAGLVNLVQKKLGAGEYLYIAQRTARGLRG